MKIPVYRMFEHNEAYFCWDRMIREGHIPETGNYLLHVDHHDDLESGGYDWDFFHRPESLEEVERFTYEVLGIADFICPAVYYALFSDVHIMKNLIPQPIKTTRQLILIRNTCELKRMNVIPFVHSQHYDDPEYHFFNLHEGGLLDRESLLKGIEGKSVVLDVDLDYFCWDDSLSTQMPKRMEITEAAYREYRENRYHPFRVTPKRLFKAVESEGKYYLEYCENIVSNKRVDKEKMERRMDRLIRWFEECGLAPAAIDICSSHLSGYLPADLYPWIEETFLRKLSALWDLEFQN